MTKAQKEQVKAKVDAVIERLIDAITPDTPLTDTDLLEQFRLAVRALKRLMVDVK